MASALVESGCNLKIGDLAFALGIPIFPTTRHSADYC